MKRTSEAAGLDDATRAAYESALAEAQLNLRGNSALKLPWECGVYAQIFSDAELPPMPDISKLQVPLSEFSRPSDSASASVPPPPQQVLRFDAPVFQASIKRSNTDANIRPKTDREAVLRRWLCIVGHNLAGSKVGDLLTRDGVNGIDLMSDVMGGKSTSTLVKRARFAGRMIQWANESKVSFFPLDISTVRDFMKTLETASAIKECGETQLLSPCGGG